MSVEMHGKKKKIGIACFTQFTRLQKARENKIKITVFYHSYLAQQIKQYVKLVWGENMVNQALDIC